MRFLRSSAFAKAEKLMFAASCSAADAISYLMPSGGLDPKISGAEPEVATVSAFGRAGRLVSPLAGLPRGNERDGAAGLFHRLGGAPAGVVDRDRDFRGEHALAEQPHTIPRLARQAGRQQGCRVHRLAGIEPARIDCRLQPPQIDLVEAQRIRLGEAALGQPAIDRHLTALEACLGAAGPRRLALAAAPGRLAEPGADAAANPLAHMAGARLVGNAVELHGLWSILA